MKARLQVLTKQLKSNERGAALVLVVFFMIVLFGFAALSIDVARVYQEQRHINVGTDAGALAGVILLPNTTAAIAEARNLANANGVTDAEIAAGARNGFPGLIQVGQWSNWTVSGVVKGAFFANATPPNAIRVPARRTVELYFAKVVGMGFMRPAVDSVAIIGKMATAYGVPSNAVASANIGDTVTLHWWTNPAGGNWGTLDLCATLSGQNDTVVALSADSCFATIGDIVPVATGFDGIKQGFASRYATDPIVTMPVTTEFPSGSHTVTIVDFVQVQLLGPGTGGGSGYSIDVKILAKGLTPGPQRALVE